MARKLPSIFDAYPKGVPVTAEDLERAMEKDHEDRTLAALDRAAGTGGKGDDKDDKDGKDDKGDDDGPAGFSDWNGDAHPRSPTGQFAPAEGAGTGAITSPPPAPTRSAAEPLPAAAVRALPHAEAVARTGLSAGQLAGFRRVVSVDEFVTNPPADLKGAILLGKTRNQPHNLYWHVAATHDLQPWTKTYPQSLGPRFRDRLDDPDCTRQFMDGLFAAESLQDKPIVFLCPTNILKPGAGKYTRQEMEYLLADPERAKRVVLVAGTDDYLDREAVAGSADTARKRFDRVRATLDARRSGAGGAAPAASPVVPQTHPAEFDDLALFEWDAEKHPRGEAGRFGPGEGAAPAPSEAPPVIHSLKAGLTAALNQTTATWATQLDPYELGVVEFYTGSLYKTINPDLRDHPDDIAALPEGTRHNVRALDAAIRKYPEHAEPLTSYRGVKTSTPEKAERIRAGFEAAYATGGTVRLDGFVSSSIDPFVALTWGTIAIEIKSNRGAYLGDVSSRASEKEVLHTHGERFKVTAVADRVYRTWNGHERLQKTYTLEAVPEPPPPLPPPAPGALFAARFAEWDPDKHPRGERGQFGPGGSSTATAPSAPPLVLTSAAADRPPAVAAHQAASAKWLRTVPTADVQALRKYMGSQYYRINAVLRGVPMKSQHRDTERAAADEAETRAAATRLTTLLASAPRAAEPVTSYRGVRSRFKEKLAAMEDGFKAALASGGVVTLAGLSSASVNPLVGATWTPPAGFVLEMKSRTAPYVADASAASDARNEDEILHNHNSTFRVTGVRTVEYRLSGEVPAAERSVTRTTYTLEEVEPVTPAAAPPAAFYHPDQVRDDHGRWAGGDFDPRQSFGDSAVRPAGELLADDLPEPVRAQATAWAAKLTPDERGALQSYVYFGYQEMNRAMAAAGGDPRKVPNYGYFGDPGRRLHLLADAADKHPPLETPLTGWRFMASKPERMAAFVAAADAAAAAGGELTMPVFGSTTLNPEKAVASSTAVNVAIQKGRERDTVLLEITSRTGLLLGPAGFSDNPALEQEENEVLQRPTARYRVLGWKDVSFGSEKRRVLRLDEIPPETPRPTPVEPPAPAAPPPVAPPPPPPPPPGLWGRLKKAVGFSEWDPDKHPRGDHGQFGPGGESAPPVAPAPTKRDILVPLKPQDLEGDTPLGVFTRRGRAWADRLDKAAFGALKAYTGVNYRGINKALRKHPDLDNPEVGEKARKWAKRLQAALATHTPTAAPVTSYRGIKTTAKSKLPKIEAGFAAALASGEPVTLNGFSSATLDPSYAAKWTPAGRGLVLELKSRRGVYIASASHMPQEEEVLHTHASQFKVTGVRKVEYQTPAGSRIHTTYTLEEVEPPRPAATPRPAGPPAQFDWDPDKHPRGEAGRWASTGSGGPAERDDPAARPDGPTGGTAPTADAPAPFPAVAAYAHGRGLAARVAALPHATEGAVAKVAAAKAAFKQWPADNPDGVPYGPEHSALYRAVDAAEAEESSARRADREAFLAAYGPVQKAAWQPDTSGCKPHGFNKAFFLDALRFVEKLVPESAGADTAVVVKDGRGPSYTPGRTPEDVGRISAPSRTHPTAFAHELGHHLEHTIPGAQALCNEFLKHRAGGETPADLYEMGLTEVEGATGYKDHFDRVFPERRAYYAGRVYPSGGNEILAMGLEALHDDPVGFAKKDPEYFAFVMGVLSGDLTGKGTSHAE